jgi:hypothetical protein
MPLMLRIVSAVVTLRGMIHVKQSSFIEDPNGRLWMVCVTALSEIQSVCNVI